jgi:hypothetical protein
LGEELSGEHEIAEGGEELAGAIALYLCVCFHGFRRKMAFMAAYVHPEAPAAASTGSFSKIAITSRAETVRGEDCAMEAIWVGVRASRSEGGGQSDARVVRTVSRE